MYPKYHFLLGIFFIIILHFIFPSLSIFALLLIFLSSVLIDADHVLYYFFKKGNLNPIRAYNWYIERGKKICHLSRKQKNKIYPGFYLFHGIEVLTILFLLGTYVSYFFIFIFVGFSLHFVLDTIHEIYDRGAIDKTSWIWNYIRWKKIKKSNYSSQAI
jgi:hypothetical protein